MKHSMEIGWLATMLGSEMGLDIETCKTAGFLHDLGKAIDQDPNVKDAHDRLTKELMENFKSGKEMNSRGYLIWQQVLVKLLLRLGAL